MYAVIKTGGKQYRVKEGDVLDVEKIKADQGQKINFYHVLLIEDSGKVLVGTPILINAAVRAEVVESYKGEKVLIFKKKRRKQYRRTRGHRQELSRIRIDKIYPDAAMIPVEEMLPQKPATEQPAPKAAKTKPVIKAAKKTVKKESADEKKAHKPTAAKAPAKEKAVLKKKAPAKPAARQKKT